MTMKNAFDGKKVVVTGRMSKQRAQVEIELRQMGATVQSAVSGTTNILICGDDVGTVKRDAARRWGVKMLTEAAYVAVRREFEAGMYTTPTKYYDDPEIDYMEQPKPTRAQVIAAMPEEYGGW